MIKGHQSTPALPLECHVDKRASPAGRQEQMQELRPPLPLEAQPLLRLDIQEHAAEGAVPVRIVIPE
jgi:hypothetical protein